MLRNHSRRSCIVAGLLLVGALSACTSPTSPEVHSSNSTEPQLTSKGTPTSEETAGAVAGSRSNPVGRGVAAQHSPDSVWFYTIGATSPDAWLEIQAANPYNEAPGEGQSLVIVPIHIAMRDVPAASDGADPWASFEVDYVTAAGNTAPRCTSVLPGPGALQDIGMMYGGAEADFLACAIVPSADVADGAWRVGSLFDGSAVFFSAS